MWRAVSNPSLCERSWSVPTDDRMIDVRVVEDLESRKMLMLFWMLVGRGVGMCVLCFAILTEPRIRSENPYSQFRAVVEFQLRVRSINTESVSATVLPTALGISEGTSRLERRAVT